MENSFMGEMEYDAETEAKIAEEIAKMDAYSQKILSRVESMVLVHEDLIVVEKIDVRAIKSFLEFVEKSQFDRMRTSYYGRVLKISDTDSGDEIKELKKKKVKTGDIVSFNPDAAYSLNVIVPDELPELWVLSIENILLVDNGFDPVNAKKKTVEANVIIKRMQAAKARDGMLKAHQMLEQTAKDEGRVI